MRNRKPILVIEDDRIDAIHVRRTFGNGEEALVYIHDVKREIPVVILTTSGDMKDRRDCHNLGAAGFMTKPVVRKYIYNAIQTLEEYGASGDPCDEE